MELTEGPGCEETTGIKDLAPSDDGNCGGRPRPQKWIELGLGDLKIIQNQRAQIGDFLKCGSNIIPISLFLIGKATGFGPKLVMSIPDCKTRWSMNLGASPI